MKTIKNVVSEIKTLCKNNQFKQAGALSRLHRKDFVEMIESGDNSVLLYAYKVCGYFNMRQTDCFNIKF